MGSKVKWLIGIGVLWIVCLAAIVWDLYQTKASLGYIHQLRNQVFDFRQDYFEHKPYRTHDLRSIATRIESINHLSQALEQQNHSFSFHPDLSQLLYTLDRFLDQSQQYLSVEFDVIELIQLLQTLRKKYAEDPDQQNNYFKISTYVFEVLYAEQRNNPDIFLAFDRLFQYSLEQTGDTQNDLQTALAKASQVLNGYAQGFYLVNKLVRHPFYTQVVKVEDEYEELLNYHVWFTLAISSLFIGYVLVVGPRVVHREAQQEAKPQAQPSSPDPSSRVEAVVHFDEMSDILGNDEDAMVMVLKVFLQDHSNDQALLRQAIDEGRREQATRLAHSLKGIGGGLSAPLLTEAARDLEMALVNQSADVEDKLARLNGVLLRVFEEVRDHLESEK